jgi:glycine cleavage system H protein
MPAEDYAQLLVEIIKDEKGESIKLNLPEEEFEERVEESLEALPEEELGYEEKER